MNLMPLKTDHGIDYSQPAQCHTLLSQIRVTDLEATSLTLNALLEGMAVASPPPQGQLQVLEELRPTLDYVQGEAAKRYASHPLPPSGSEEQTLRQVVRLWSLMSTNYGFVAQRYALEDGAGLENSRALLAQRRLHYHAQVMIEYFRARREMPENAWRDLHRLFLAAERAGVATTRVADSLNETWGAQSPQESYVAMLLTDAASPYSRTPREFTWLVRWAQRFAPYCNLHPASPDIQGNTYLLNPDADHGLRPALAQAATAPLRSLETAKLASHIQTVVGQLKAGASAASLGLGEDCVQPACARLMVSLYRPWGLAAAGRKFPRRQSHEQIRMCTTPEAIAYFLTGKRFQQPEDEQIHYLDFSRTEAMLALGEQVEAAEPTEAQLEAQGLTLGYIFEPWNVLDQSVAGYRLIRTDGTSRLEHRQLVGIRSESSERMLLAEISWLQFQQSGSLCAGISLMPRPPAVISLRRLGPEHPAAKDRYRLGFLIPGVPALKTPPTLIVPAGWFLSNRHLEVRSDTPWFARMTHLVTRGANFDRVTFERDEMPGAGKAAP